MTLTPLTSLAQASTGSKRGKKSLHLPHIAAEVNLLGLGSLLLAPCQPLALPLELPLHLTSTAGVSHTTTTAQSDQLLDHELWCHKTRGPSWVSSLALTYRRLAPTPPSASQNIQCGTGEGELPYTFSHILIQSCPSKQNTLRRGFMTH